MRHSAVKSLSNIRNPPSYNQMIEQPKLTPEDKFAIIQELVDQIHHKCGVLPVKSDEVLQGKASNSFVHTYQIAGSDINRKTQTSNLIQKVAEAQQLPLPPPNAGQLRIDEQVQQNEKEIYRYFKTNVRCFRCKKVGHHNYACLDQQCCQYCLGASHQSEKCPQRTVCYQCYQWGHIINECKSPLGIFCQDCKRKHNRQCCFLTKGIEPIKQMFNTDYLYSRENIRCMACLQFGHMICGENAFAKEQQDGLP